MNRFRRIVGLDVVDVVLHAGITVSVIAVGAQYYSHGQAIGLIGIITAASLALFGVRRNAALKRGRAEQALGEASSERVAELEARLGELEQAQYRLQELEERVDFAERLLAQSREPERLT
jgi:hypothetical protein